MRVTARNGATGSPASRNTRFIITLSMPTALAATTLAADVSVWGFTNDACLETSFFGLTSGGTEPAGTSPEEFTAYVKAEIDKWARVAKAARVQVE